MSVVRLAPTPGNHSERPIREHPQWAALREQFHYFLDETRRAIGDVLASRDDIERETPPPPETIR